MSSDVYFGQHEKPGDFTRFHHEGWRALLPSVHAELGSITAKEKQKSEITSGLATFRLARKRSCHLHQPGVWRQTSVWDSGLAAASPRSKIDR